LVLKKNVILPKIARSVNHGTELAVVIGKEGKNIPEKEALDHVFGYTILNDIGARNIGKLKEQIGLFLRKSFYAFAPLGPCLVHKDPDKKPTLS